MEEDDFQMFTCRTVLRAGSGEEPIEIETTPWLGRRTDLDKEARELFKKKYEDPDYPRLHKWHRPGAVQFLDHTGDVASEYSIEDYIKEIKESRA